MKIAVVGCGAVGSYYGAMLCRAGHEVHLLLRSDFAAVRERGVCIRSLHGDFIARPAAAARPEDIGPADLVLIALKTTANDQFPLLLPPLVGPGTAVMTLQNGLGNEESLTRLFAPEQILGGLCFVCLNRIAPGVIRHLDHGLVMIGEFSGPPRERTHTFAKAFETAGVASKVSENLARAHWEKLVWNIPFNGLGVAAIAGYEAVLAGQVAPSAPHETVFTTDRLLGDPRWSGLVRELMIEVITAARAMKLDIAGETADRMMARTRSMGPYKASTLLDFEHGRPLELQSLFLAPLAAAQAHGVPLPRLEALCRVLQQLAP